MSTTRVVSRFMIAATLSFAATIVFAAKPDNPEPVGHMSASASGITWAAGGDFEKITLRVMQPDGTIYEKEYTSAPTFRLQDLGGKIQDGKYTYELRVTPRISATVKAQLAAAREAGDDAAADRIRRAAGIASETVQSGTLTVANGAFVNSDATEAPATPGRSKIATSTSTAAVPRTIAPNDVVTADDEIIQGSLCVGLDCVVNESFGFDTIRLKENNTRIKFNDTSTGTGFPNHNWQLTANDSNSGGANKFSIEDITAATVPVTVTGSAPTNSIFVSSAGKVGFRTSTPGLDLHVSTSDTPAIRLEQNNSGGFTAQTWDVAGNEANFFVRDLTGGSRLPFRIRPGAPTSSIDIAASGRVGIGTASPQTNVHVFSSSTADAFVGLGENPDGTTGTQSAFNIGYGGASLGRGAGFLNVRPDSNAVAPNPSLRFLTANVERMIITNTGNVGLGVANPSNPIQHSSGAFLSAGGTWTNASSRSYKQDIENLDAKDAMDALKGLQPVRYAYKVDPSEHHVGFIAEDVPNLVATKDRKSLSPMDVVAVLTKVVQEQQSTIEQLNERLAQLEKEKASAKQQ